MIARKVAVITLIQNMQDEDPPDPHELKHQIQHFFGLSPLAKLWKVDHVTFLEDTFTQLENDGSRRHTDEIKRGRLPMDKGTRVD